MLDKSQCISAVATTWMNIITVSHICLKQTNLEGFIGALNKNKVLVYWVIYLNLFDIP